MRTQPATDEGQRLAESPGDIQLSDPDSFEIPNSIIMKAGMKKSLLRFGLHGLRAGNLHILASGYTGVH